MEIKCELCGEKIIVPDDLVLGQHVRCPFCDGKFSYVVKPKEITESDLREAIAICRKSNESNKYYKNAPAGAKLYIALVFYGKVFADTLDKEAYVEAFKGIGPELKERDLRYLLQYEDNEAMREYLSERLASVCGGVFETDMHTPVPKPSQSLSAGGTVASQCVAKPVRVLRMRKSVTTDASCRMNAWSQTNWLRAVAAAVVVLAVTCVGIFLYCAWMERQKDTESVRIAVEAKRKLLNNYLDNAKSKMNELQEKLDFAVTALDNDKARFKDEMTKIETENNLRAGSARTNGRMRFNAAELAMAIYNSPILRGIYERYMGQSLAGKAAEVKRHISTEIGNRSTFTQNEVDGIEVIGNAYVQSAGKAIRNALSVGGKEVAALKEKFRKLQGIVQDAEYIVQGTDTNQMDVAITKVKKLQFSEIEKRVGRFKAQLEFEANLLVRKSVAGDISVKDVFVIDNSLVSPEIDITDDLLREVGIDPVQFKNADPETRKHILVEVRHDIEMRREKFNPDFGESNTVDRVNDQVSSPQNVTEGNSPTNKASPVVQPQLRKCHRCWGKGVVIETVNEKCEDCEGRGYIMKKVTIKDTKYSTDGHWNYRHIGNRVTRSRQNCERCKHRGKIAVKCKKECPTCKGSGYFTEDGEPYKKPKDAAVENAGEISQWLIPTAENGGAIWHYLNKPEHSWFEPGYDHSKWFDGRSAFVGRNGNLVVGTEWNCQDIYLRKRFKFDGDASCIKVAKLRYTIDDVLQVWLNGEKIVELSGVDENYREIDVTKELVRFLRKGDNVIAAWAHDCCGRRNVDIGLYVSRQANEGPNK